MAANTARSIICIPVLILLVNCVTATPYAQFRIASAKLPGNVTVFYDTFVMPPSAAADTARPSGGAVVVGRTMKRYLVVGADTYFGYDMTVEPPTGAATPSASGTRETWTSRITFAPLSLRPADIGARLPNVAWRQRSLPTSPETRTVGPSELIEVDLFVNAAKGQKIVDRLIISDGSDDRAVAVTVAKLMSHLAERERASLIRDLTTADVEMRLESPWLMRAEATPQPPSIDLVQSRSGWISAPRAVAQGGLVWVTIPGLGRVTFSLLPRQGFEPAGYVAGMRLNFSSPDGKRFWIDSRSPILPSKSRVRIYARVELLGPTTTNAFAVGVVDE